MQRLALLPLALMLALPVMVLAKQDEQPELPMLSPQSVVELIPEEHRWTVSENGDVQWNQTDARAAQNAIEKLTRGKRFLIDRGDFYVAAIEKDGQQLAMTMESDETIDGLPVSWRMYAEAQTTDNLDVREGEFVTLNVEGETRNIRAKWTGFRLRVKITFAGKVVPDKQQTENRSVASPDGEFH